MASIIGFFYSGLTLSLGIFILTCSLREGHGSQNHPNIAGTSDNITYELDACAKCTSYRPFPTHSLRICSVGRLKDDIRELKRILGEVLLNYASSNNMAIEEEERNGMFINYNYQTVLNGNKALWMQTYDKIHSTLHEISLNMTVMEPFVHQRLVTSFLNSLQTVMCYLQATLKLAYFTEEDMHLQVTCNRSLTLSLDIARSTGFQINFAIQSLLTARDALNEIYNVVNFHDMRYLQL
ncbi:hypothetical protein ACJMK2_004810 [Sinanodonta woodiana]|uniref:Uncharacterized protein n=1 Tax=Sinanodonta woodiana TaxID=1069815 RepID=A0ABD3VPR0_SINWO